MSVRLEAGASTVHWGYLDATLPPLATIDSGDVVTISTVSGPPEALPPPPANVPGLVSAYHWRPAVISRGNSRPLVTKID